MLTGFLPLILLYPEVHYRFRYFKYSKYYIEEPEIFIDMPYKTTGSRLPVFLIIKDADLFPVLLWSVRLRFNFEDGSVFNKVFLINEKITDKMFYKEFEFRFNDKSGFVGVSAEIHTFINKGFRQIINDNFFGIHSELEVYLSDNEELFDDHIQGDLHYHSEFTSDQVEFGAPVMATKSCAAALGLGFFALTDHSYDLDDEKYDYLNNDPDLKKFTEMKRACEEYSDGSVRIIPGEEVTVRNGKERNVHLNIYDDDFFYGSGDSAEKWLSTKSENSISDVVEKIKNTSLAIAAHPFNKIPRLEYFLVKRGMWSIEDILNNKITHLQILNGEYDENFFTGLQNWIKLLLKGERIFITAGNDAHGNFNIFRQVKMPMFELTSEPKQIFGKCRTVVFSHSNEKENIISAVRSGNMYITNGPHLLLSVRDGSNQYDIGSCFRIESENPEAELFINSSRYSGTIKAVTLFRGFIGGSSDEKIIWNREFLDDIHCMNERIFLPVEKMDYYIRLEVFSSSTHSNGKTLQHRAYSNPIWIKK